MHFVRHRSRIEQLENRSLLTGVAFSDPIGISQPVSEDTAETYRAEVIDLDRDGDNDILRFEKSLFGPDDVVTVVWHVNQADGFDLPDSLELGDFKRVSAVDVDGDGDPDLVGMSGSSRDPVVWYENRFDEGGSFSEQAMELWSSDSNIRIIDATDLNGDSRTDLLYMQIEVTRSLTPSSPASTVFQFGWFENLDDQNWLAHDLLETESFLFAPDLDVVDFDLDGDVDIMARTVGFFREDHELVFFENTGGVSTFAEPSRYTYPGRSIDHPTRTIDGVLGDIDQDGDVDIVNNRSNRFLDWMENVDGQLVQQSTLLEYDSSTVTRPQQFMFLHDVDDDGMDEMIFRSRENFLWFDDVESGSYSLGRATPPSLTVSAVGDIDGDGDHDIVEVNGGNVRWFDTVTTDSPSTVISTVDLENVNALQAVDVDGDGDEDAVLISRNMLVWYEKQSGEFGTLQILGAAAPDGQRLSELEVVDLNMDGVQDFVVRYHDPTTNTSDNIAFHNTAGSLSDAMPLAETKRSPVFLDIDGDGAPELFDSESSRMAINDGTGTFGEWSDVPFDDIANSNATDVDLDGDIDVVAPFAWFENIGNGEYSGHTIGEDGLTARLALLSDLDGDGDDDALFVDRDDPSASPAPVPGFLKTSAIDIWENRDGEFIFAQSLVSPYGERNVVVEDLNGDGAFDIYARTVWFQNNGGLNFDGGRSAEDLEDVQNRTIPAQLSDVDQDGLPDLLTLTAGSRLQWKKNFATPLRPIPTDIDRVFAAIRNGDTSSEHDRNGDGMVDTQDVDHLVTEEVGTRFGDLDFNGRVDFLDLLAMTSNFGKENAGWADGDLDGDGKVAFSDFLRMSLHFGFDRDRA